MILLMNNSCEVLTMKYITIPIMKGLPVACYIFYNNIVTGGEGGEFFVSAIN